MSNNNTEVKQLYACDDVIINFAIPFFFLTGEEFVIKVYLVDNATSIATLLTLNVDYTLNSPATTVTTTIAYPSSKSLLLKRVSPRTQLSEYVQGPFPFQAIEDQFDRVISIAQELQDELNSTIKMSDFSALSNVKMPEPSANKYIGWNSSANGLENKNPLDLAPSILQFNTLKARVDTAEVDIADLQINDTVQDLDINALQSDVLGLDNRTDLLEANYTALGATVADIPADIQNLQDQIDLINDRGADVDQLLLDVADHELRISAIEPQVVQLTTRINQLEATKDISMFSGSVTLHNNQVAPVAIVDSNGFVANDFKRDADGTQLAMVDVQIDRRTDTQMRFTKVRLAMRYISETGLWYIGRENTIAFVGEPDGVTFSIVTTAGGLGQVYYTTDNMSGANYSGKLKFVGKEIPTGV